MRSAGLLFEAGDAKPETVMVDPDNARAETQAASLRHLLDFQLSESTISSLQLSHCC
jgi:hypothetical protein